jgi:hypothetical protein
MATYTVGVIECAQRNQGHLWGEPFEDPVALTWAVQCVGLSGCGAKCLGATPEAARQEAALRDQANLAGRLA